MEAALKFLDILWPTLSVAGMVACVFALVVCVIIVLGCIFTFFDSPDWFTPLFMLGALAGGAVALAAVIWILWLWSEWGWVVTQ